MINPKTYSLNLRGTLMSLDTPCIMGILNITDDSFYPNSRVNSTLAACHRAAQMLDEGAHILDVGATSTRPGAALSTPDQEWQRLKPALGELRKNFSHAAISVDTYHSVVAQQAADMGADIINDVSGGTFDAHMFETVAKLRLPYILMHTPAPPAVMQQHTDYKHVVQEVIFDLSQKIQKLHALGLNDVVIDPGFGFGKTIEQNFIMLKQLSDFSILNKPMLVGVSRKGMIYKTLGTTPDKALNGSSVLHTIALERGAHILRVHDVKEAAEVIKLVKALQG